MEIRYCVTISGFAPRAQDYDTRVKRMDIRSSAEHQ
jgi:hypothetical protein